MRRAGRLLWGLLLFSGAAGFGAAPAAPASPLSAEAQLGRRLFFDVSLSASGRLACASCHDPTQAYAAPATAGVVMTGGAHQDQPGLRTVPSLRYLQDTPRFTRHQYVDTGHEREDTGPAGGFTWDGRADSLTAQALIPLFDPAEMANASAGDLAARLRRTPYARELAGADGPLTDLTWVRRAAQAIVRFEEEDDSFHPYRSRFDRYLAGRETLSSAEMAGLAVFTDPGKGNCAACHPVTTGPGGRGPVFTDHSYHALGVPRNPAIPANRDPRFFDQGLCGPARTDLRQDTGYCGYFKTPTLRNVARRRFFFHNGRFTRLREVLRFYAGRDVRPADWYPSRGGRPVPFDDLPPARRDNVNRSDAPLNRMPGERPALDERQIDDLLAFLRTLNDDD